jgi:hypothetical protein
MKVIKTQKRFEGLLEANLEHEISKTTGTMDYTGPKIPSLEWHKVLSFFRWCQATYKSECQARLFVNPALGTWRIWAFPQKARTGMTAQEIETEETKIQRAQFPDPDWIYFGTIHHHCNGSAFQSSVDRSNEESQDGLHITVGKMDEAEHELHVRFYLGTDEFNPDMSRFWDIGLATALLPERLSNEIARWQMAQKIDVEFPQQWKDNVIEIKYTPTHTYTPPGSPSFTSAVPGSNGTNGGGSTYPDWKRATDAIREIQSKARLAGMGEVEVWMALEEMEKGDLLVAICDAIYHHKVEFSDIMREAETMVSTGNLGNDAPGTPGGGCGGGGLADNDYRPWLH